MIRTMHMTFFLSPGMSFCLQSGQGQALPGAERPGPIQISLSYGFLTNLQSFVERICRDRNYSDITCNSTKADPALSMLNTKITFRLFACAPCLSTLSRVCPIASHSVFSRVIRRDKGSYEKAK